MKKEDRTMYADSIEHQTGILDRYFAEYMGKSKPEVTEEKVAEAA